MEKELAQRAATFFLCLQFEIPFQEEFCLADNPIKFENLFLNFFAIPARGDLCVVDIRGSPTATIFELLMNPLVLFEKLLELQALQLTNGFRLNWIDGREVSFRVGISIQRTVRYYDYSPKSLDSLLQIMRQLVVAEPLGVKSAVSSILDANSVVSFSLLHF
jgi:hypothetical protein